MPQPNASTSATHCSVHAPVQHRSSWAHTQAAIAASSHDGVSCASQQAPSTGPSHMPQPSGSTSATQSALHTSWQQPGALLQTHACTAGSAHPGPSPASQQSPSSGWHTPQPSRSTFSTQVTSHCAWQQNGSCAHTQASIVGSRQPGPSPGMQQAVFFLLAHPAAGLVDERHAGVAPHVGAALRRQGAHAALDPGVEATAAAVRLAALALGRLLADAAAE
ncbi:hypothetical protein [Nannocystis pusilla]|uniref:hypothetical protein n=1 Tax=Nannocystis pusilla TaxID=889268 RepID=UPI003B7C0448